MIFLFVVLMFFVDVVMDCEMVVMYYREGNYKWVVYMLVVVIFLLVFIEVLLVIFYCDD